MGGAEVLSGGGARGGRGRRGGGGANMVGDMGYYAAGGGAKGARPARSVTLHVWKFHVGPYTVNVQYPLDRDGGERLIREKVYKVFDKFPPGSDLNAVSRALAKLGACFAPWTDKTPGNYSTPRHPVYK